MGYLCNIWSTTSILWSKYNLTWSECELIQEIIGNSPGVDASLLSQPWNPYKTGSLDKRKRLIKLICKVNGREYPEEHEVKNFDRLLKQDQAELEDLESKWLNPKPTHPSNPTPAQSVS